MRSQPHRDPGAGCSREREQQVQGPLDGMNLAGSISRTPRTERNQMCSNLKSKGRTARGEAREAQWELIYDHEPIFYYK